VKNTGPGMKEPNTDNKSKFLEAKPLGNEDLIAWLRQDDEAELAKLWATADVVRRENVGDAVHLRGLVELSNACRRSCLYCGLRAGNNSVKRYRMSEGEILQSAKLAERFEYGTIVLQSGEDPTISGDFVARLVDRIKKETSLAVTLSLGERKRSELVRWRNGGADRYLLRFETSRRALFDRIHPRESGWSRDRLAMLADLRELGYEVGSGVMVGIPGQTYEDLARDIWAFRRLDLDMIGCGPFIAHPDTPLGDPGEVDRLRVEFGCSEEDQVPNSKLMGYKVFALSRLICPTSNIPCTTTLATLDGSQGRILGLTRGANVVMPNLTPLDYRRLYEIYPNKASSEETPDETHEKVMQILRGMCRAPGQGQGDSLNHSSRTEEMSGEPYIDN
jgi:biotin synthase